MNISINSSGSSSHPGGNYLGAGIVTPVRRCLCHDVVKDGEDEYMATSGDSTLRCAGCVRRILQPYINRHERALENHESAKRECARQLRKLKDPHKWVELQAESEELRAQLARLKRECGDMAVRVAAQAVENDSHRDVLGMGPSPHRSRIDLQRLQTSLLEGSMVNAVEAATRHVRVLRFQWARKVLTMHRLDIDPEDIKLTPLQKRRQETQPGQQLQRRARGIAKIAGLPLPNAGPELYGVLPPKELQSALRLVAVVASTVARCLGIVLPHPILLTLSTGPSGEGDITELVADDDLQQRRGGGSRTQGDGSSTIKSNNPSHGFFQSSHQGVSGTPPVGPSSTSSFMSLMDGSYWTTKAKKALAKATGQQTIEKAVANTLIPPSTDATIVAQRLEHTTAAILADDDSANSSKFTLSAEMIHHDDFAVALQLLQNNVIVLCIRAGVPVAKLWPAEAMLLNLKELDAFCQQQTAVSF
jgi:hypothetical protein